ncbi:MAG TPA: amidase [Pseudolabrys sp.]|jgi:Asp-tRNA(Asn)/Glu-tRNA(Gln) amidotransferase A subunit family amidase|nr:amidase [Pseudolabrys sp.]
MAEKSLAETITALRGGAVAAEQMVEGCLARIEKADGPVQAWTFLDPEYALAQARALDKARAKGQPIGPLHGIPVGIKDIFDTSDMPTENGTVLHAGRQPQRDSFAVALLRQAGAVIVGKTVTTEMALFTPGKTRNPHDPARTPGGSSSGSAAAVAAGMVPLAVGSQTNGSTIRPAAFCGVVGYKPTHGLISRQGALLLSHTLDHVGIFAASVTDAALLAEIMMVYDGSDPDMRPRARPELSRLAAEELPSSPKLAFLRTSMWGQVDEDAQTAFEALVGRLGRCVEEIELPSLFEVAIDHHRLIQDTEVAVNFAAEYSQGRDKLSQGLVEIIEHGLRVPASEYLRAVAHIPQLVQAHDALLHRYDAILTPAVPGEAPVGTATGNPIFCTAWTLLGVPAVSLPLLRGRHGLPIGVQLLGQRGNDGRLLRTARWITEAIAKQA